MSASLRPPPRMTREQFLDWVATQWGRWEFDGFEPVPVHRGPTGMTGGTLRHNRISQDIWSALRSRLRDGPCEVLGPDAGVATSGDAARYPDALVTCVQGPGDARLAPGVVVVFEVMSRTSRANDRSVKLNEYRAVPSIRRHVLVESDGPGLMVMEREDGAAAFTAGGLTQADVLRMPEIGIEVPVSEFSKRVGFDEGTPA